MNTPLSKRASTSGWLIDVNVALFLVTVTGCSDDARSANYDPRRAARSSGGSLSVSVGGGNASNDTAGGSGPTTDASGGILGVDSSGGAYSSTVHSSSGGRSVQWLQGGATSVALGGSAGAVTQTSAGFEAAGGNSVDTKGGNAGASSIRNLGGSPSAGGTTVSTSSAGSPSSAGAPLTAGAAGMAPKCTSELIAPATNGGLLGDLSYDAEDGLHVAYVQAIDRVPNYAYYAKGAWHYETISSTIRSSGIEIEIDPLGAVHAVLQVVVGARKELAYARRIAKDSWTVESALTPSNGSSGHFRLYLDTQGAPVIVYGFEGSSTGYEIRRLRRQSSQWSSDVLTNAVSAAPFSVFIDKLDRPWIATQGRLIVPSTTGYHVQNPIGWTSAALDFAVDESSNEVYLSAPGGVVVGNGSFWAKQLIPEADANALPILHIDTNGKVIAAFPTKDPDRLISTFRYDDGVWLEVPDVNMAGLRGHAVVTATYERPHAFGKYGHVAQFDSPGELKAVRVIEDTPTKYVVHDVDVRPAQVQSARGMAEASDHRVYVAYAQGNSAFVVEQLIDGSWRFDIPKVPFDADVSSLTLDPLGQPVLAVTEGQSVGCATLVERAWETRWLPTGIVPSVADHRRLVIVFDGNDLLHAFFTVQSGQALQLWHIADDHQGPRLLHEPVVADIALQALSDKAGTPHVVFNGPGLRMARWEHNLWQTAAMSATPLLVAGSFVNAMGDACVADPASTSALRTICDHAATLVTSNLAAWLGPYQQLTTNSAGGAAVIVNSLTGIGSTTIHNIELPSGSSSSRSLPLMDDPSLLVLKNRGLRVAHFKPQQQRLYVTSCSPE